MGGVACELLEENLCFLGQGVDQVVVIKFVTSGETLVPLSSIFFTNDHSRGWFWDQ